MDVQPLQWTYLFSEFELKVFPPKPTSHTEMDNVKKNL